MSSNDAADILRGHLAHLTRDTVYEVAWLQALDNALEEERRATVERIRAEIARTAVPGAHSAAVNGFRQTLVAILDEEAAR